MLQKVQFLLLPQVRCFSSLHIKDITSHFDNFKRIMVMVGAGLSTPSGIPDFRSPGTGLYSQLEKYNLQRPEDMFDLDFFKQWPEPFFELAKELYPGKYKPNICHYFIYLLQEKGKLLRLYTQNIDGLERMAGIKEELLVEAHGTFSTASCIRCKKVHDPDIVRKDVFNNIVTQCKYCKGIVKPDVVFFGEGLPQRYHNCSQIDPDVADLLIVMGTSLEVYPFAWLSELVPVEKFRLLINRENAGMIGARSRDVFLKQDLVRGVQWLTKEISWYDDLKNIVDEKNSVYSKS